MPGGVRYIFSSEAEKIKHECTVTQRVTPLPLPAPVVIQELNGTTAININLCRQPAPSPAPSPTSSTCAVTDIINLRRHPRRRKFPSQRSSPFGAVVAISERPNFSSEYPRHVRDFPEFFECVKSHFLKITSRLKTGQNLARWIEVAAVVNVSSINIQQVHVSFSLRKFPNEVRIPIKVRTPDLGLVGDKYSRLKRKMEKLELSTHPFYARPVPQ
ncbi:hypothetical protein Bbelb_110730 [Branchiostoma belcheri]|nr:hypothetical protein Bbelb_110730 [Branchiostoma belcheri]